jgi:hypothetical protein
VTKEVSGIQATSLIRRAGPTKAASKFLGNYGLATHSRLNTGNSQLIAQLDGAMGYAFRAMSELSVSR